MIVMDGGDLVWEDGSEVTTLVGVPAGNRIVVVRNGSDWEVIGIERPPEVRSKRREWIDALEKKRAALEGRLERRVASYAKSLDNRTALGLLNRTRQEVRAFNDLASELGLPLIMEGVSV